jgi:hypothetical protein
MESSSAGDLNNPRETPVPNNISRSGTTAAITWLIFSVGGTAETKENPVILNVFPIATPDGVSSKNEMTAFARAVLALQGWEIARSPNTAKLIADFGYIYSRPDPKNKAFSPGQIEFRWSIWDARTSQLLAMCDGTVILRDLAKGGGQELQQWVRDHAMDRSLFPFAFENVDGSLTLISIPLGDDKKSRARINFSFFQRADVRAVPVCVVGPVKCENRSDQQLFDYRFAELIRDSGGRIVREPRRAHVSCRATFSIQKNSKLYGTSWGMQCDSVIQFQSCMPGVFPLKLNITESTPSTVKGVSLNGFTLVDTRAPAIKAWELSMKHADQRVRSYLRQHVAWNPMGKGV